MRAARVDGPQKAIVAALRKCGCLVLHLHTIGAGCPDILVGHGRRMVLMEIKDGTKPPSAQRLTPLEHRFHDEWRGHSIVVTSVDEALTWVGEGRTQAWRSNVQGRVLA